MAQALNATVRVIQQTQAVFGTVTVSGTTPSLTAQSGETVSDQTQASVARSSQGVYVITLTNFRGPQSYVMALATGTTTSTMVANTSNSYTANTDTVAVTFSVEDDASTLSDTGFNFLIMAF